LLLKRYL